MITKSVTNEFEDPSCIINHTLIINLPANSLIDSANSEPRTQYCYSDSALYSRQNSSQNDKQTKLDSKNQNLTNPTVKTTTTWQIKVYSNSHLKIPKANSAYSKLNTAIVEQNSQLGWLATLAKLVERLSKCRLLSKPFYILGQRRNQMLTQKLQQNAVKSTQKGTQTFKLGNPTTTMTPTMTQTLHPNSNANQYAKLSRTKRI